MVVVSVHAIVAHRAVNGARRAMNLARSAKLGGDSDAANDALDGLAVECSAASPGSVALGRVLEKTRQNSRVGKGRDEVTGHRGEEDQGHRDGQAGRHPGPQPGALEEKEKRNRHPSERHGHGKGRAVGPAQPASAAVEAVERAEPVLDFRLVLHGAKKKKREKKKAEERGLCF